MTDNEIIKALESLTSGCFDCNDGCKQSSECPVNIISCALDLINRKDVEIEMLKQNLKEAHIDIKERMAEIERLREENKNQKLVIEEIEDTINPLPFETDFEKAIRIAKSEAIKEFAERLNGILKKKRKNEQSLFAKTRYGECILAVDNLVKEMTEGCEK